MMQGLSRTIRIMGLVSLSACALVLCPAEALAQESASYVMDRLTITSTASVASSASFEMAVTFGQEGPIGTSAVCGGGPVQSAGFWSILGDLPVPVVLSADLDTGDPSAVLLSWTGSAGLFELFRSDMADTVAIPANSLLTTSACGLSDPAPAADIFYYLVNPAGS